MSPFLAIQSPVIQAPKSTVKAAAQPNTTSPAPLACCASGAASSNGTIKMSEVNGPSVWSDSSALQRRWAATFPR
jgi:hypothetical protein